MAQEADLRVLTKRPRVEVRLQQRARVLWLVAAGWQNKDIAVDFGSIAAWSPCG